MPCASEEYHQVLLPHTSEGYDEGFRPYDSEIYHQVVLPHHSDCHDEGLRPYASEMYDQVLPPHASEGYDEGSGPCVSENYDRVLPPHTSEVYDHDVWPYALEEQQPHVFNDNILGQFSEQPLPVAYEGALCLSWKLGNGRHPMVTDDEVSYIMDCLKCINNSVATVGLEQLAVAEGLCLPGEVENMDPDNIIRQTLEQMLQTKSRNGNEDIFVTHGAAYSSGYKKKVPLHVFVASAPLTPDDMDAAAGKDPTMTVLWDWNVKLQCITHQED